MRECTQFLFSTIEHLDMFGTSGVRGAFGDTVTTDLAVAIGRAVAADGATRVVVGRDPRTTGPLLADAVSAGLREYGADVVDCGVAATPTIARGVGWQDADAGIAVTASHNPPADNGFKLWTPSGMAFNTAQRDRIADLVEAIDTNSHEPAAWDAVGERTTWSNAAERHRTAVTSAIDAGSIDLNVIVDIGNGAGGVTIDALRALGCDVETLNADPDGRFPGRPSEPTEETCVSLCAHVAATDADLGIAHDGDADRMLAVDETGSFVRGDALLALFARTAVDGGKQVAVPLNTSLLVDDAVESQGGEVVRTRVGDVFVAERTRESDVVFGGEPSGAWIWPTETLAPDGTLAACRLAAIVARKGPLSSLVATLGVDGYPLRRESYRTADKEIAIETAATAATARYDAVTQRDGVRVETDTGWFLVRASGTQPLVRVTAEGRREAAADDLFASAVDILPDSVAPD